eukprot:c34510_g1_i1.p1 GENE.c34510_g1_i1~~c34510_g1_i1.p1  ORF type:complete len:258 (+),score=41.39 c34510_g1_i1:95-775(+)
MYVPVAINMVATLSSVSLFLRWGAFGTVNSFFKRYFDDLMLVIGVAFFALTITFAGLQAHHISDSLFLGLVTVLCGVCCLVVCSVAFLISGFRFVKHLRESASIDDNRLRSIGKAVRWITISGVCLFVQIAGFIMLSQASLYYAPMGQFASFALIFYGMSLSAVSQALAFRPITDSHRKLALKLAGLARGSTQAQSGRRRLSLRRLTRLRSQSELQLHPRAQMIDG